MCYATLLTWSCGCIVTQHLVRCQAAINNQPCETQRQVHRVSMDCASHKTVSPQNLTTVPPVGNFVEEMRIAEAQWNKEYEEERAARLAAQAAADAREQAQIATELWEESQIEAQAVADAEAYEQAQEEARAVNYARAQAEEAAGMRTLMAQAQAQAQVPAPAADQDMEDVEELQPPVRKVGRPRNSSRTLSRGSNRSLSRIDYSEPSDKESEELEPFVRKVCRPRNSNPLRKAESKNQKSNRKTAPSWAYVDEDEIEPTQEEIFERIARQSS